MAKKVHQNHSRRIIDTFLSLALILILASGLVASGCGSNRSVAKITGIGVPLLGFNLQVNLAPTDHTKANTSYTVDLYEKGKFRATSHVTWSQPELNANKANSVTFPLSDQEWDAYHWSPATGAPDLSKIFSAKVHE